MASPDEIWIVDLGDPVPHEPALDRPALIIGPPLTFGEGFPFVIVVSITTVHRGLSLHVEIEPGKATGLDEVSYIQCELVRSVSRKRLIHRLGMVNEATSNQVTQTLRTLLGH